MNYIYIEKQPFPASLILETEYVGAVEGAILVTLPDGITPSNTYYNHYDGYVFMVDEYIKDIKIEFRQRRNDWFYYFDILKTNSMLGLIDALTAEEIQWYKDVLSFSDTIDEFTTKDDYPEVPARISKYLVYIA